jgi:guanylate kinase
MTVIISGPSGVGKNTILRVWQEQDPRVTRVITHTTRSPRPGEVNGREYHFVNDLQFDALVQSGDFLDHRGIFGARYGLARSEVARVRRRGKIPIIEVDVYGGLHILQEMPHAISIFLLPPSENELRHRLSSRGSDSVEAAETRLARARAEKDLASAYRFQVVNDEIVATVARIRQIVDDATPLRSGGERCKLR